MAARLLDALWTSGGWPTAAGGTVRFYQPKTLTQVNVFSDDAAQTIITQPVSLDSNGRTVVPVYTTAPVRAVFFDSTGAQLIDVERVNGDRAEEVAVSNTSWPTTTSVDSALTKIAASLGGKDGAIALTLAGSVSRLLSAKLQDIVSVKDFGAKGDGVTDDTAALNACLATLTSGGSAFFPAGTYLISSPIAVSFANVSLIGLGPATSIIQNTSGSGNAITLGNVAGMFVRDLGISHSATSTGAGIAQSGTSAIYVNATITGHKFGITGHAGTSALCSITTTGTGSGVGITTIAGSTKSLVVGCTFASTSNLTDTGVRSGAGAGDITVGASVFANVNSVFIVGNATGGTFTAVGNDFAASGSLPLTTNNNGMRFVMGLNSSTTGTGGDNADQGWVISLPSGTATIDLSLSKTWKIKQTTAAATVTLAFTGTCFRDERITLMLQNRTGGSSQFQAGTNVLWDGPFNPSTGFQQTLTMMLDPAGKLVQVGAASLSNTMANT